MTRARKTLCTAALILLAGFAPELMAQENLEKMVEKLMASNTTTRIINYNGPNKSLPTYTAKISIYDKPLLDEFINVFNSEKKSADMSISNTKSGDAVTSAIFTRGGISYMYSYFIKDESNGLVLYSKYPKMGAATGSSEKLTADSMRSELKIQHYLKQGLEYINNTPKIELAKRPIEMGIEKILLSIPYRIDIPGQSIITDGEGLIKSNDIGFGSEDKVPLKTDKKITIKIPKGHYIYINKQKHTVEQARKRGLNVETF